MKNSLILLFFIFILSLDTATASFQKFESGAEYEVSFSPNGECQNNIITEINKAQKSILIQAYYFTSASIAKALINANKKGIDVKVILDKSQVTNKYSSATFLNNMKIPVWIDYSPAIAHNKIIIIDDFIIITGSFNFTKSAQERNAENILIVRSHKLAAEYTKYWKNRLSYSLALKEYKQRNR